MKTFRISLFCILAIVAFDVSAGSKPPGNNAASSDWTQRVGKKVTVVGIAQNAKSGAILLVDGEALYLQGKESWEAKDVNQKIRATGRLAEFQLPVASQNEKGEWSAGVAAPGTAYRLEKFTWESADAHE